MAGETLIETVAREQTKRDGEAFLPMATFRRDAVARRNLVEPEFAQRRVAFERAAEPGGGGVREVGH